MAVKIRLARFGRNKVPFYHIVVTDSRNRRDSKFIEKIGTFNPLLQDDNKEKVIIKKDRAEYWLGVGALPSDRVALLLIKTGVNGAEKFKPVFIPKAKVVKEEVKAVKEVSTEKSETSETATETVKEVSTEKSETSETATETVKEEPAVPETTV